MKFIAENGKITVDNTMTKAEAEERLVKMKARQTNIASRLLIMSEGDKKISLANRKISLDAKVTNLDAEIKKI